MGKGTDPEIIFPACAACMIFHIFVDCFLAGASVIYGVKGARAD
jgi:hypothetical protein